MVGCFSLNPTASPDAMSDGRTDTGAALALVLMVLSGAGRTAEWRCGWLENPSPANYWLRDRQAEWTLSIQGGYGANGYDDHMVDMTKRGWVETNVHYGYGCACLDVVVDPALRRITRLVSAKPVPLAQCRADKSLPRP